MLFLDEALSVSYPEDPISEFDRRLWNAARGPFGHSSAPLDLADVASPLNASCVKELRDYRAMGDCQESGPAALRPLSL